jgi:hypothetical protein
MQKDNLGKTALPIVPNTTETLQSPASIKHFIDNFMLLQKSWKSKSPSDRLMLIKDVVNQSLNRIGIPDVEDFKAVNLSSEADRGTQANFSGSWEMKINQALLNQGSLSNKNIASLAGFVYHETRHAEQFFRIAQLLSQSKIIDNKTLTADEIYQRTRLPKTIAQKAIQAPPLTETQSKKANLLYQSLYGSRRKYRDDVLNKSNLMNSRYLIALDTYNQALDKKERNPNSISNEKINQLLKEVQSIYEYEYKPAYKLYRELPEEKDAFEASDLLEKSYSQRLLRSKSLLDKQKESSSSMQSEGLSSNSPEEKPARDAVANKSADDLEQKVKDIYKKMYIVARGETTGNYFQDDVKAAKNLSGRKEADNIMRSSSNAEDMPEPKKTDYLKMVFDKASEQSHENIRNESMQRQR